MKPLPRVESVPLGDQNYRVRLEAIVSGGLAPGARVRDQDLANGLSLSRTPVREALRRLADEWLVETRPRSTRGCRPYWCPHGHGCLLRRRRSLSRGVWGTRLSAHGLITESDGGEIV